MEEKQSIEKLRWAVLSMGQQTKDKRKWGDIVERYPVLREKGEVVSATLAVQIFQDSARSYKFYDSLAMLLSQFDKGLFASTDEAYLRRCAELYLEEE